ncbi:MAG: hypothetical protein WC565_05390 [Parcubacteria group bacterium]
MEKTALKLKSFGLLFKESLVDYKSRFKTIAALSAISLAVSVVLPLLALFGFLLGLSNTVVGTIFGTIGTAIFILAICFVQGAFIFSMKDGAGVKESFRFIRSNFKSFLWIAILSFCIVFPGSLLLFFPGAIISMFIIFSSRVFMDEGKKGFSALKRSIDYVRGYFWPVVGRHLLLGLITIGALIVSSIVIKEPFNSLLNAFVIAPIGLCFSWRLYKDLKEKRPEVASSSPKKKGWIKAIAIIGIIIVSALTIAILVFMPTILKAIGNALIEQITKSRP